MPKNTKGGKKHKRGKNAPVEQTKELILKQEGQVYAKVLRLLGNCRVEAQCYFDQGKTCKKLCVIPGKFRKKVWINKEDIILVGIRDFQDDKADVIYKYDQNEARRLAKKGEIPDDAHTGDDEHDVAGFEFQQVESNVKEKERGNSTNTSNKVVSNDYLGDMMLPSDSEDEGYNQKSNHKLHNNNPIVQSNKKQNTNTGFSLDDFDSDDEINLEDL